MIKLLYCWDEEDNPQQGWLMFVDRENGGDGWNPTMHYTGVLFNPIMRWEGRSAEPHTEKARRGFKSFKFAVGSVGPTTVVVV